MVRDARENQVFSAARALPIDGKTPTRQSFLVKSFPTPARKASPAAAPAGKLPPMEIRNRETQAPFTTRDGSTIRSLLDLSNAPVKNQSLAEASIPAGGSTERHHHKLSEEFYHLLEGAGLMEIDGVERSVGPGDTILIPPGAWHRITAVTPLRFLCCCAPPYSHEDTYFA